MKRPDLTKNLDADIFLNYYYLKEELIAFCKKNELQTTGGKIELTQRIAHYLKTGEKKVVKRNSKTTVKNEHLTLDTIIETDFVCSQIHREFFKKEIGKKFSFNVTFQNWLKEHNGLTYQDAIHAYYKILEDKKNNKTKIDRQFEYNTYIRDFYQNNKGRELKDAIRCWNYKKGLAGHHRYEDSDLKILEDE